MRGVCGVHVCDVCFVWGMCMGCWVCVCVFGVCEWCVFCVVYVCGVLYVCVVYVSGMCFVKCVGWVLCVFGVCV